ncbi:MAG: ABC transporter ATP-binding protein [Actinomycetota bacterium]|nr:ABC transporter ATP-binding protein [Actinomycetota bacterium]
MTEATAIAVEDVCKRYRLYHERNQTLKAAVMRRRRTRFEEFWALSGVSLEAAGGTTLGLIGENGSGKSTLLKCMAKILRPDSGSIRIEGKLSALLELGAGFHPELTGKENVYLNGAILGLGRRDLDRKFDDIVGFAGLERFIDTPVKNYSSGMYVRLGFSVAINVDPDVLLVDEVLAVGDESFQRRCNEKFADLKAAGTTIVIVSHDLEAVRRMCDEVAWLEHGQLRRLGPAPEVVDDYIQMVTTDRQEGQETGARWGSGEGRIERIEVLNAGGAATTRARTGEAMALRFHYSVDQPIDKPVVNVHIHSLEGVLVAGASTRDSGGLADRLEGRGFVDHRIDRLVLVPGTYEVTVSLSDWSLAHFYDVRFHALRFDVEPGAAHDAYEGLVSLGGTWVSGTAG